MTKSAEEEADTPLGMSDEEIEGFDWNAVMDEVDAEDTTTDEEDSDVDSEEDITDDDDPVETPEDEIEEEPEEDTEEEKEDISTESNDAGDKPESEDEGEENEEEVKEPDYQEEYNKVFAPFKANGKMMQIDNAEDARTLMQMGANYNKKMAGLKPTLKIVKMLENNDLLDESKLNFLIDLDKKDPEAIKKLLQDSKLDVDEIDLKAEGNYKPQNHAVNGTEIELDEILSTIKETESYATTLNIIGTKWDEASRDEMTANPNTIAILNNHVANGWFDQIEAVMEKEKALGRLAGMTDIAAYTAIGDALNAQGKLFNKADPGQGTETKAKVSPVSVKKATDPKLKDKKRAASGTKSLPGKGGEKASFSPLALSDEEFEKQGSAKFL